MDWGFFPPNSLSPLSSCVVFCLVPFLLTFLFFPLAFSSQPSPLSSLGFSLFFLVSPWLPALLIIFTTFPGSVRHFDLLFRKRVTCLGERVEGSGNHFGGAAEIASWIASLDPSVKLMPHKCASFLLSGKTLV